MKIFNWISGLFKKKVSSKGVLVYRFPDEQKEYEKRFSGNSHQRRVQARRLERKLLKEGYYTKRGSLNSVTAYLPSPKERD